MDSGVLSWVVAAVGAILNLAVTTTITILIKRWFDRRDKKEKENAEAAKRLRELEREAAQQHLREAMAAQCSAQIAAVRNEIEPIITKLEKIENGTLSGLRTDILSCYYECLAKHYRNDWDYTNIHDLYEAYKRLGGNSFVADVISRFDALPPYEEYKNQ